MGGQCACVFSAKFLPIGQEMSGITLPLHAVKECRRAYGSARFLLPLCAPKLAT